MLYYKLTKKSFCSDLELSQLTILGSQGVLEISIFIYLPERFSYLFTVFSKKIFPEKSLLWYLCISLFSMSSVDCTQKLSGVFWFQFRWQKNILQMWLYPTV